MAAPSMSEPPGRGPCHEECPFRRCGDSIGGDCNVRSAHHVDVLHRRCCTDASTPLASKRRCAAAGDTNIARYRRRRALDRSFGPLAVLSAAAIVAASIIPSAGAFGTFRSSPALPQLSSALGAVRKRSGNHDVSSRSAAAIAASRRRQRKSNVFEQFTPEHMTPPFDVDLSPANGHGNGHEEKNGATVKHGAEKKKKGGVDMSQIRKGNKVNLRLRSLLKDDTGEQEMELYPDHSLEAAEQLADRNSYSKLNEEARRKANLAVSVDEEDEGDEGETERAVGRKGKKSPKAKMAEEEEKATSNMVTLEPTSSRAVRAPRRRRVRATVKETGSDSISTYIKSLGQHELLYKEDEVLLGRQVRLLVALEDKRQELEEELLRPPTFAQWADATNHTVPSLKRQIRRSHRAKAALIEANLRLVITVARQAVKKSPLQQSQGGNSVEFQDACQQGIIGLARATEKFDPELGFRFSTYAIWWIQKEVARNVSEQSRSVRVPQSAIQKINDIRIAERVLMVELGRKPHDEEVAERVGMSVAKLDFYRRSAQRVGSLDKKIDARKGKGSMATGGDSADGNSMDRFVKDTEHPSPSEMVDQQMLKEDIRRLVRTLSPREQAVIRLRFGLDDGKPPLGLADIGAKFGVDVGKIKKIEARALLKLRQPGRSHVVRAYISDHT